MHLTAVEERETDKGCGTGCTCLERKYAHRGVAIDAAAARVFIADAGSNLLREIDDTVNVNAGWQRRLFPNSFCGDVKTACGMRTLGI